MFNDAYNWCYYTLRSQNDELMDFIDNVYLNLPKIRNQYIKYITAANKIIFCPMSDKNINELRQMVINNNFVFFDEAIKYISFCVVE